MFKKYKKNLSLLIAGILAITLVACSNTAIESDITDSAADTTVETTVDVTVDSNTDETDAAVDNGASEQDENLKLETSASTTGDNSTTTTDPENSPSTTSEIDGTTQTSAKQTSQEAVSSSTNSDSNSKTTTKAPSNQTTTQRPSTTARQTTTTARSTTSTSTKPSSSATNEPTTRPTTTQTPTTTTEKKTLNVSLTIDLSRLIDNPTALPVHIQSLVPASGYLARNVKYEVEPGTSALDILRTYLNANGIQSDIQNYPTGAYIAGINNISQFDAGGNSGWQYSINGNYPNQAIDRYELKDGDVVIIAYIIDYLAEGS